MKLKTVIEAKTALIRLTEKRFCNYRNMCRLRQNLHSKNHSHRRSLDMPDFQYPRKGLLPIKANSGGYAL